MFLIVMLKDIFRRKNLSYATNPGKYFCIKYNEYNYDARITTTEHKLEISEI